MDLPGVNVDLTPSLQRVTPAAALHKAATLSVGIEVRGVFPGFVGSPTKAVRPVIGDESARVSGQEEQARCGNQDGNGQPGLMPGPERGVEAGSEYEAGAKSRRVRSGFLPSLSATQGPTSL